MRVLIVLIAALGLWACDRGDREHVGERADEPAESGDIQREDPRPDEQLGQQMQRMAEYPDAPDVETEVYACEGQLSRIVLEDDVTAVLTTEAGPQVATYELEGDELHINLPDGESLEFVVRGDTITDDEDTRCMKVG